MLNAGVHGAIPGTTSHSATPAYRMGGRAPDSGSTVACSLAKVRIAESSSEGGQGEGTHNTIAHSFVVRRLLFLLKVSSSISSSLSRAGVVSLSHRSLADILLTSLASSGEAIASSGEDIASSLQAISDLVASGVAEKRGGGGGSASCGGGGGGGGGASAIEDGTGEHLVR